MEEKRNSGLGFSSILTLIFITLKLCGIINWCWFLVLLPIIIKIGLLIIIFISAKFFENRG